MTRSRSKSAATAAPHCSTRSAIWNASSLASGAPEGVVLRHGAFYGPDTGVFDAALIQADPPEAACHSSAARSPRGGRSCKSMTQRRQPPWRSNSEEASTISSTMIPRQSTNGCPRPPQCSAQSRWIPRAGMGQHSSGDRRTPRRCDDAIARAGSNAKARRELNWRPLHPSWRQGFAEIVQREAQLAA